MATIADAGVPTTDVRAADTAGYSDTGATDRSVFFIVGLVIVAEIALTWWLLCG